MTPKEKRTKRYQVLVDLEEGKIRPREAMCLLDRLDTSHLGDRYKCSCGSAFTSLYRPFECPDCGLILGFTNIQNETCNE